MDKQPLRGPEDLRRLRGTPDPETTADVDVERAGADPADVGLRPDTDHPTPRDNDPEEDWIEQGSVSDAGGPAAGLPPVEPPR
jgi:hypothetical protein